MDEEEEANKLIDQIPNLQKTLDDLTSRMDGAWKFPLRGLIKIHYSNSSKKRKCHKVCIVSMVLRDKNVKLSLLCQTN